MVMSLANMYTGMAQAETAQNHQVSMMKKALNQFEDTASQTIEMLDTAAIHPDSTVDIKL